MTNADFHSIITVLAEIVQSEVADVLKLDYKSGVPICDQIVMGFIRLKAIGALNGGNQMPSVRSLAIEMSVNPNTIQKAYQQLETMGVIYSVKGKGSYISDDAHANLAIVKKARETFAEAVSTATQFGLAGDELIQIVKEVTENDKR